MSAVNKFLKVRFKNQVALSIEGISVKTTDRYEFHQNFWIQNDERLFFIRLNSRKMTNDEFHPDVTNSMA